MKVQFRSFVPADVLTVRKKMAYTLTESTRGIVAYDTETAETLAVFLAEGWTQNVAVVHQVILKTMVLRHGWFEEISEYMFTYAARKKLYTLVPSNHKKALSLNAKLGFKQIARLEDAISDGVDNLVLELKREDCPYWGQPALRKVS